MKSDRSGSRAITLRLLWIVPLALVLLYATAAVSVANIAYRSAPEFVLRLYPGYGPALGASAFDSSIRNAAGRQGDRTRLLAQQALEHSPTTTSALRALALRAEQTRDEAGAVRLMDYAFGLSRRDLPVLMWLIEARVRQDDVPGALHLYDVALRSSRRASSSLLPILVNSTRHEWMLPYLAQTLAPSPAWGKDFSEMLIEADVPARNKVALFERLRNTQWFGAAFRQELVSNLVANEDFLLAASVTGKDAGFDRQLVDAFEIAPGTGPFNWKLSAGYQIDTAFRDAETGRTVEITMDPEYSGPAARLLMLLPAGSYRLSSQLAGRIPADLDASWTVACAGRGGRLLTSVGLSANESAASFSVPGACQAQWLTLTAASTSSSPEDVAFEVGGLSIRPQ